MLKARAIVEQPLGTSASSFKPFFVYMDASRVNQKEVLNVHFAVGSTYFAAPHQILPDFSAGLDLRVMEENLVAAMGGRKGKSIQAGVPSE
jgi:hypothetical protein